MIDQFLRGAAWDEAPEAMRLEESYALILQELGLLLSRLRSFEAGAGAEPGEAEAEPGEAEAEPGEAEALALRVLVRAPALVNVVLNYKICVEHGLPLHPTVYYELAEARRYKVDHPLVELERANRLYRSSIELARAACRLDHGWEAAAREFAALLPQELLGFVYTSGPDRYTWRASEPAKLADLADKVRRDFQPDIIVAAAHGSIMPALILAEYLALPLYFLRFSMFKRQDEAPIISLGDEAWLSAYREGSALIYDEDVAKGTTLGLFAARLAPLFARSRTACSIRHGGAGLRPDFVARVWWD